MTYAIKSNWLIKKPSFLYNHTAVEQEESLNSHEIWKLRELSLWKETAAQVSILLYILNDFYYCIIMSFKENMLQESNKNQNQTVRITESVVNIK